MTLLVLAAGVAIFVVSVFGVRLVRRPVEWDPFDPDSSISGTIEGSSQRSLVAGLARRLEPIALSLAGDRMIPRYAQRLQAAGNPDGVTVSTFLGRKAAYTVVFGFVGVLLLANGNRLLGLGTPVVGFLLQDLWLRRAVRKRQEAIERNLPDFLDVLAITVDAGLSFQAALRRVAAATGGALGEEIERTLQQMGLGMSRREAFDDLRHRNDSDILTQFVTALLQAEELGAPLADSLRTMADDLREAWYQQARRMAARAAPRISMIVSFTLVPASMFLIVTAIALSTGFSVDGLTGG